jgi:PKD repeat protein
MKKSVTLIFALLFLGLFSLQAQYDVFVSGQVTDEVNGDPIVNHPVHITANDSTLFYSTVYTDQYGSYNDTVLAAGTTITSVNIATPDNCMYLMHDTTFVNPPNQIVADFLICNDTVVPTECQAAFYYYPDSLDFNTIVFYDYSTANSNIESWAWAFGDGTSSTEQNPTHVFADTGMFNVCLTIVADAGACTSTFCEMVYVYEGGSGNDCQAFFYYDYDSLNAGNLVSFFDMSTATGQIDYWFWEFGDGATSGEQNPNHEYTNEGTYNVCLTILSDDSTCSSTFCEMVYVYGGGTGNDCQAYFYYDYDSLNTGTLVSFFDMSTSSVGQIDYWFWDFGDGASSTEQNPSHEYADDGTYNVCLTIIADDSTCSSTFCELVYVFGGGTGNDCQAFFYYSYDSLNTGTLVSFVDMSVAGGQINSWYWDFGDGANSSEQNPNHEYANQGTYNVCLTIVSNEDSCTSTLCEWVYVYGGGGNDCQANFSYYPDSSNSFNINFIDLSTSSSYIDSWFWEFGDGTSSSEQFPMHAFGSVGTYNVCLTITADSGFCTSTTCLDVYVGSFPENYLGGNVFAGIYQLDNGFAYAYKSEDGVMTEVYAEMMDTLGYYLFYPMQLGDYFVKVEPSPSSIYYGAYLPTYYGDVIHWEDATMIGLTQNLYNEDINLVAVSVAGSGPGGISGTVVYAGASREDTPAHNIQIMLANAQGEYVGILYSDEDGTFSFDNLPIGDYTLYAEVMGKTIVPKAYQITDEEPAIENVIMLIKETEIVYGIEDVASAYVKNISDIYPNPVSNLLQFDINVKQSTELTYSIINYTGQIVYNETSTVSNSSTVKISTGDLKPGIYMIQIITPDNVKLVKNFIKM